ncbi:MAG: triacylglycerol lipase [Eubacterium sp.]|nr:triacylglycerol lipase [Eubacterium sp.]
MEEKQVLEQKKGITSGLSVIEAGSRFITFAVLSLFDYGARLFMIKVRDVLKKLLVDHWISVIILTAIELIVFLAGGIIIYMTSVKLGMKIKVIGAICGLLLIAQTILVTAVMCMKSSDARFEKKKLALDAGRQFEQICDTRYPLLMIHGVFFRDLKCFNYWGRIPEELEKNGAKIFYGNNESATPVEVTAKELADRVKEIVRETGCEKVNIIAHSKGGIDVKYAVAKTDIAPMVASITTINTPHAGCEYADYLLGSAPEILKKKVANAYNTTLRSMGEHNPDFISAVSDITTEKAKQIEEEISDFNFKDNGIYTQSVGSKMKQSTSGAFPLNMSFKLVGRFDGPNDGLVGEHSFQWGEDYTFVENKRKRGISHGDMIDLTRENIKGFDVREFYVQLVAKLKFQGL